MSNTQTFQCRALNICSVWQTLSGFVGDVGVRMCFQDLWAGLEDPLHPPSLSLQMRFEKCTAVRDPKRRSGYLCMRMF